MWPQVQQQQFKLFVKARSNKVNWVWLSFCYFLFMLQFSFCVLKSFQWYFNNITYRTYITPSKYVITFTTESLFYFYFCHRDFLKLLYIFAINFYWLWINIAFISVMMWLSSKLSMISSFLQWKCFFLFCSAICYFLREILTIRFIAAHFSSSRTLGGENQNYLHIFFSILTAVTLTTNYFQSLFNHVLHSQWFY